MLTLLYVYTNRIVQNIAADGDGTIRSVELENTPQEALSPYTTGKLLQIVPKHLC